MVEDTRYRVRSVTGPVPPRSPPSATALGANRSTVLRMVLRDAAVIASVGIVAGAALSLALGRYVESQLYGIGGRDVATLASAAGVLAAAALASGWLPVRRASRVDPAFTLRQE